jgi:hypothetical protein
MGAGLQYVRNMRARMWRRYWRPAPICPTCPTWTPATNLTASRSMTQLPTFEVQSRRHGTRIFHHVGTRPYQRLDGGIRRRLTDQHRPMPFKI